MIEPEREGWSRDVGIPDGQTDMNIGRTSDKGNDRDRRSQYSVAFGARENILLSVIRPTLLLHCSRVAENRKAHSTFDFQLFGWQPSSHAHFLAPDLVLASISTFLDTQQGFYKA